ncbi:hypothetical protein C8Q74DRAFT_1374126 [Fomes fomentarius]|nr:hypothetical protein C8Q74DRAFT_1374126 [Fomes fomentarius]
MPMTAPLTRRDFMTCDTYIILVGASGSTFTTLAFLYVLWRFPKFIKHLKAEGADPTVTSFEFFRRKEEHARPSPFLNRTLPTNMFPRLSALPDGKVFMAANNQSINPTPRNSQRRPRYEPSRCLCDPPAPLTSRPHLRSPRLGSDIDDRIQPENLHLVHLPNGQIVIANGAQTGFAGFHNLPGDLGESNADKPAFIPSIYFPDAPLGERISNANMAEREHRVACTGLDQVQFPAEHRVQILDPPYMTQERPKILSVPEKVGFGQNVTVPIKLPRKLCESVILGQAVHQAFACVHRGFGLRSDIECGSLPVVFGDRDVFVALVPLGLGKIAYHPGQQVFGVGCICISPNGTGEPEEATGLFKLLNAHSFQRKEVIPPSPECWPEPVPTTLLSPAA